MNWQEFLALLKNAKATIETGVLNLDAGSLVTMLYAGSMDSLLPQTIAPTVSEYEEYAQQIKAALGSKAGAKKASKTEDYGIADISHEIILHLWRNQADPTYQFDWSHMVGSKIEHFGFQRFTKKESLLYIKRTKQGTRYDVWASWGHMVNEPRAVTCYLYPKAGECPAFIGSVVEAKPFKYSNNTKEAMRVKIFTGSDTTESITVWPARGHDFLRDDEKARLREGAVGIAVVSLKMWNDRLSPSLVEWVLLEPSFKLKKK